MKNKKPKLLVSEARLRDLCKIDPVEKELIREHFAWLKTSKAMAHEMRLD